MKKPLFLLLLIAISFQAFPQKKWGKMRILPLDMLDANVAVILTQSHIRMYDHAYLDGFQKALVKMGLNLTTIGLQSDIMYSPTDMDTMITKGGEPKYLLEFYDDGLKVTLTVLEYKPKFKNDHAYGRTLMTFSHENLLLLLKKFGKRINELKTESPKAGKQMEYSPDKIKIVDAYGEAQRGEVIIGFPAFLKDIKLNFFIREAWNPEKQKTLDDWNSAMRKQMVDYPFYLNHYPQTTIVEMLDNAERYFFTTSMERKADVFDYRKQDFASIKLDSLGLPDEPDLAPISMQKYYVRSYLVDMYDNKIYAGEARFIDKDSYLVYKYFLIDAKAIKKGKYDYPKPK